MNAEHYARNATIPVPVDLPLISGTTLQSGEAANLTLRLFCLQNGRTFDHADSQFRTSPATPTTTVAAFADYTYDYFKLVDTSAWPRGHYRALMRHSTSSREFAYDFTVGLMVPRQLGYSAVYDGATLNLSVWVEEAGVVQTDYTELKDCVVTDCLGSTLADGTFGDNSSPSANGVFNFQRTIALAAVTNYIFECKAIVPGPATLSNYSFRLRVGIARP